MLRFLQKRRNSRSTASIEKVTHGYSEIDLGESGTLPTLVRDDIDSGFSDKLSQSGRSFSCEDLLLVGSLSQSKRRLNTPHTSSSTSTDQTSHTPSGSIDDHDYCDIGHKNNPLSSSGRLNAGNLKRIKDATKLSRKTSDSFRYQNIIGRRFSGEFAPIDELEYQKLEDAYEEALKYGAVDVTYVRLMLIGLPEAGKTTTRFSLMGEKAPNNLSRTKLVEPCQKPIRRQLAVTGNHGWSYINHEQEDEDLALLLNRLMNCGENDAGILRDSSSITSNFAHNFHRQSDPESSLPIIGPTNRSASLSPFTAPPPLPPKQNYLTMHNPSLNMPYKADGNRRGSSHNTEEGNLISPSKDKLLSVSLHQSNSIHSDTTEASETSLFVTQTKQHSLTTCSSTPCLLDPQLRIRRLSAPLVKYADVSNNHTRTLDTLHRKLKPSSIKIPDSNWSQNQFLQQGSKFRQKIKQNVFNKLKEQGENECPPGFDNEVLINIWDCGGQFVFREILPAFLAQKVAYLLIYDASKDLETVYQEPGTYPGCYAEGNTFHHMQKWMAAIHAHSTLLLPSASLYPRMLVIGTHGDALKTGEGSYELAKEKIISKIKSHFKGKRFADLVLAHFIVDNTTGGEGSNEDSSFEMIRCQVEEYAKQSLTISTPISWVLFRRVFQATITEDGIPFVSMSVAKEIAAECKIDEDTLSQVLVFYHQVGLLLHYASVPILDEVVIADPQWLVNSLSLLFSLHSSDHEELASLWTQLHEKGVLEKALYESIWSDCGIDPQGLLNLLEYFLLAAPIKPAVKQQFSDCAYFVPSLLSSWASEEEGSNLEEAVQTAAPLFLVFNTEYVPPGFFIRLAATFSSVDGVEIIFDSGVYRNRITFSIGEADELTIVENLESIKITLARYFDYKDTSCEFSQACLKAKHNLLSCCSAITQQWMPAVKATTAFQCQKVQCRNKPSHYIHFDNTVKSCLRCSYSKIREKPSAIQKLWLQPINPNTAHDMKDEVVTMKLLSKVATKLDVPKLEHLACHLGINSYDAIKADNHHYYERSMAVLKEWYDMGKGDISDLQQALQETGHHKAARLIPTKYEYSSQLPLSFHSGFPANGISMSMPPTIHLPCGQLPFRQSFRKKAINTPTTKELTLSKIVQMSSRIKDESKVIVLAVLLGYSEQEFFDMQCDYHTTRLLALHMITEWWKKSDGTFSELAEFLKAVGLGDCLQ